MPAKKKKSKIWYLILSIVLAILFVTVKDLFLRTPSICKGFNEDYKNICLQLNAHKLAVNDFDSAWEVCEQINQDPQRGECFNNIVIAIGKEKPKEMWQHCEKINSEKWSSECFFNIALSLTKKNITKAFAICDKAEIYVPFCYHDVAGEISLINTEAAINSCEKQTDDLIKRTCFHGIGKYLGRSKPEEAIGWCNKIKDENYKGACYNGMGWGISEITNSSEAVLYCKKINSNFVDNCLVGVGWQTSATNYELSKKICKNIIDEALKTKCLNFQK